MIEVEDLYKRFGNFEALRDVSFRVERGESVGLLGENGAGKTTTLRVLACFLPPTRGTVRVAGHDVVFESEEVRRRIGYMPESVPVYGTMRVEEFVLWRARIKGLRGREAKEATARALGRVDLGHRRRSLVQNLSKGLRQRVGLADALVHDPDLLILDEPTSGLDPTQRREVRELVRELRERHTVLVSSHILPEVEASCDRVVVMHRGTVAAVSGIEELRGTDERDRFRLVVSGSQEALRLALEDLEALTVEELGAGEADTSWARIDAAEGEGARSLALRACLERELDVVELVPLRRTLEEVFDRLVREEEAA